MWPSRRWRARGWLGFGFGLFAVAATIALAWLVASLGGGLAGLADPEDMPRPGMASLALLGFVGLPLALGMAMVVAGLRQAISGRRSRGGALTVMALVSAILVIAFGAALVTGADLPRVVRLS